ncbi:hypothetical protein C5Y96_07715 [Blastopirellula marina]|uniref:Uncharacterized protein n=1 Tax=Blastopirellula marina TaxID=124 RepID=A0A2S8FXX3_9BACT|nr:hypothetical protein C5Y96_07715 [Blastopirellula marina]RCS53751.1 hypothetical protein DTL36_07725 [Bremerella cremea]
MQKWYGRSGNLSPEQWEAEQKRIEEQQRDVAQTFLFFAFPILMLMAPISGPIVTSILGIWLVIGSGSFWWRVVLTMGAVFVMGCWAPYFAALLLWVLFLSITLTYGMSLLFSRVHLMPTRTFQFSLWHIGGCTFLMAASLAMLRGTGFSLKEFAEIESHSHFFLLVTAITLNAVLASIPILVPARYRKAGLFGLSAILVLLLLPNIEIVLITPLTGWSPRHLHGLTFICHIVGLMVVWLFVLTIEAARGFCDVELLTYNVMEADESDPLGLLTLSDLPRSDEGT